jgi:uncharacterized protein (DUF1778 family)
MPNEPAPEPEKATSEIVLRVTPSRKARYVRAANKAGETLAGWMFRVCDREAKEEE